VLVLLVASATATPIPAEAEPRAAVDAPLISGTSSYVRGTYVWTGYAYNDRGPNTDGEPGGDAVYPSNVPRNGANLIQLRISSRGPDGIAIDAMLETLLNPAVPLVGVGFDSDRDASTGARTVPGGGWTTDRHLGLDRFVAISSSGARVLAWRGGVWRTDSRHAARVDPAANTMRTVIPRSSLDPGKRAWRTVAVAGLAARGSSWLDGSGAIYNLGFVRAEAPCTMPGTQPSRCIADPDAHLQDIVQGDVLAGRRPSSEAVAVLDFAKIERGTTQHARADRRGYHTMLYRSKVDLGEGVIEMAGKSVYAGPFQPYLVRLPHTITRPTPMILYLHGGGGNHLSCAKANFATFDPDAVIVCPLGRGPFLGYGGRDTSGKVRPANAYGEQDVLDVLADVERRFAIDRDRVIVGGYSNGAVGSFHFAEFYPDRFAGIVPIAGTDHGVYPTNAFESRLLENLLSVPVRMANGALDPLANLGTSNDTAVALDRLGDVDFRAYVAMRRHHEWHQGLIDCVMSSLIAQDRVKNPPRVVYHVDPAYDVAVPQTNLSIRHTGAYWVSGLGVRGTHPALIDVTSLARPVRTTRGQRVYEYGENVSSAADYCGRSSSRTNDAWLMRGRRLVPGPNLPTINGMDMTLSEMARVTLDLDRMAIDAKRPITMSITGQGRTTIGLAGPWARGRTMHLYRDGARIASAKASDDVLRLTADLTGTHNYVVKR
jgi:predicted esterase